MDDYADLRRGVLRYLSPRFECVEAGSLAEAEAANPDSFDIILLDVGLPDGSGITWLGAHALTRAQVITMSGVTDDHVAESALAAGARRHLEKPFGLRELAAEIQSIVDDAED